MTEDQRGSPERIASAQRGNREALAELVREHYAEVFRFIARRVGTDLAEDAAQETFVTVQHQIKRLREPAKFRTWLLSIAHNHARNAARKAKRETPMDLWTAAPSAEGATLDREVLRSALQALSEEHRQVVVMHELEGLRYAEIAEVLGIPEGTVKSRLHHAFVQLRARLTGEGGTR